MSQPSSNPRGKKVLVPSRYRHTNRESCKVTPVASSSCATSSSPKNEHKAPLQIHDSIASVIRPDAGFSLSAEPTSMLRRCRSMTDIGKNYSNLSETEVKLSSTIVLWTALAQLAQKALGKLIKDEEELQKTVMEKLKREAWMGRWLEAQKSIDLQIAILQRLLKLLKGDDGLLTLLRHLHDSDILPVKNRFPIEGITVGENLSSELYAARQAQENFVASVTGDLEVLGEIAQQLDDLASVVFSSTDWLASEDVIAKLSEASHLCLHLTSLRVHRLQQGMAQKLSIFSS